MFLTNNPYFGQSYFSLLPRRYIYQPCNDSYRPYFSGSESVRKTKAMGERLQEANNINKGLLALGNCVSDICANKPHIPFRNSTLTKGLRGKSFFS